MASITRREYERTDKTGKRVKREVWRARVVDPTKPPGASAKVEQVFALKRDAERWVKRQESAIDGGHYVARSAAERPLRDVAAAWRGTWAIKPLSAKTQLSYASLLERHVLPRWGDVRVGAITTAALQAWIGEVAQQRHAEPSTTVTRSCAA